MTRDDDRRRAADDFLSLLPGEDDDGPGGFSRIADAVRWGEQTLRRAGITGARLQSTLLVGHALGQDRAQVLANLREPVDPEAEARIRELVDRRAAFEPLQYLRGRAHFLDFSVAVESGVFIPRPETELVVEAALDLWYPEPPPPPEPDEPVEPEPGSPPAGSGSWLGVLRRAVARLFGRHTPPEDDETRSTARPSEGAGGTVGTHERAGLSRAGHDRAARGTRTDGDPTTTGTEAAGRAHPGSSLPDGAWAVDVGTGSGIIAIALARARPAGRVLAIEQHPRPALAARANARALEVADRVHVVGGDLLTSLGAATGPAPDAIRRAVGIVVCNPPYAPEESPDVHREVRDHEPREAWAGGPRGTEVYERLIPQAADLLLPGRPLVLELGYGQEREVPRLLAADGRWEEPRITPDFEDIPRVLVVVRAAD